jgi:hypothetical protein
MRSLLKKVAGATTLALLAVSAVAVAQPSYAHKAPYHVHVIKGVITSFNGRYDLLLRDKHHYIDNVRLHQGTVINPTGVTLTPGMHVTIYGEPNGTRFDANIINTKYHYLPVAVYPGPYWGWGWGGPWGPAGFWAPGYW